jgi:cell fate regulator YaaT (PSP1 superfamily)
MQDINIVGVQFQRAGKIYEFEAANIELMIGDQVVVESERGPSQGQVVKLTFGHANQHDYKPIIRKLSPRELNKDRRLTSQSVNDYTTAQVQKRELDMKLLKVDVQFGGSKVIIYFSSPGRVDFRGLVKDLSGGLKTRVELKQVGARDETKILGGIGICGREYCCSSFLREFVPVSIRMAKNQNLALNPHKVSGGCGRLLCCLNYENDTYTALRKVLPPRGTKLRILSTGMTGIVLKSDLLNQEVSIRSETGEEQTHKILDTEILERGHDTEQEGGDWEQDSEAMEWAEGLNLEKLNKLVKK